MGVVAFISVPDFDFVVNRTPALISALYFNVNIAFT